MNLAWVPISSGHDTRYRITIVAAEVDRLE